MNVKILKKEAKTVLTESLAEVVGVTLLCAVLLAVLFPVYIVIIYDADDSTSLLATKFYLLATLILYKPLKVGYLNAFNAFLDRKERESGMIITNIFSFGFGPFLRNVGAMILVDMVIILKCFLFLIPGIIACYQYSMVPYILRDEKNLSITRAMRRSRDIMAGKKIKLFELQLRFLPLVILCIMTLGFLSLWLYPYYAAAQAAFYRQAKSEYDAMGRTSAISAEEATGKIEEDEVLIEVKPEKRNTTARNDYEDHYDRSER